MTNEEFKNRVTEILKKASIASDLDLSWLLVSDDPDCIADFGCDRNGNIILMEDTYPLKINDLTDIRYRYIKDSSAENCYLRFEFGKEVNLDFHFDESCMGDRISFKYHDENKWFLYPNDAIKHLEEIINKAKNSVS